MQLDPDPASGLALANFPNWCCIKTAEYFRMDSAQCPFPRAVTTVRKRDKQRFVPSKEIFCNVRVFDRDNGELWIFKVQLIEVLFHLIYSRWFSATTQRLRQQPELRRAGGSE